MYKIDKNIPQPHRGKALAKYPWNEMEIGDSFFVCMADLSKGTASINAPVRLAKDGFRIAKRTLEENGVKGVRVWRIA